MSLYDKHWMLTNYASKDIKTLSIELGVSTPTIRHWLKKHGAVLRSSAESSRINRGLNALQRFKDAQWLYEQYVVSQKSVDEIATMEKCSNGTISKWLQKHKIKTRQRGHTHHIKYGNHFDNKNYIKEVLIGELLGDGSIISPNAYSAVFSINTSNKLYLEWLRQIFISNQLMTGEISSRENKSFKLKTGEWPIIHRLQTKRYAELLNYRLWFYPDGKKIIPIDIILTPTVVLHWYLGDGGYRNQIILYTNGFSLHDNNILVDKLNSIGLPFELAETRRKIDGITRKKSENNEPEYYLRLKSKYSKDFFNYIGDHPPTLYTYKHKWP